MLCSCIILALLLLANAPPQISAAAGGPASSYVGSGDLPVASVRLTYGGGMRHLLDALPNNYGNRAHAKIRVDNVCVRPVMVSVRFQYDPWGVPTGCATLTNQTNPAGGTDNYCTSRFVEVPAFDDAYIADTGANSWQYTAYLKENTSVTWGNGEVLNMRGQPCELGTTNCHQWSQQSTGGFETAFFKSNAAVLGCDGYLPLAPPPAPPAPPPAPAAPLTGDSAEPVIIAGAVLGGIAVLVLGIMLCMRWRRKWKVKKAEKGKKAGRDLDPLEDPGAGVGGGGGPGSNGGVNEGESKAGGVGDDESTAVLASNPFIDNDAANDDDLRQQHGKEEEESSNGLKAAARKLLPFLGGSQKAAGKAALTASTAGDGELMGGGALQSSDWAMKEAGQVGSAGSTPAGAGAGAGFGATSIDLEAGQQGSAQPETSSIGFTSWFKKKPSIKGTSIDIDGTPSSDIGIGGVAAALGGVAVSAVGAGLGAAKHAEHGAEVEMQDISGAPPNLYYTGPSAANLPAGASSMNKNSTTDPNMELIALDDDATTTSSAAGLAQHPLYSSHASSLEGISLGAGFTPPPTSSAGGGIQNLNQRQPAPLPPIIVDPIITWVTSQIKEGTRQLTHSYYVGHYYKEEALVAASRLLIKFEELEVVRAVDQGTYGRVYYGKYNGKEVAIKMLIDVSKVPNLTPTTNRSSSLSTSGMDFGVVPASGSMNSGVGVVPGGLASQAEGSTSPSSINAAMYYMDPSLPVWNSPISPVVMGRLIQEANLMAYLRHPNIISLTGICDYPPCIVTEWCSRGSLSEVITRARLDPGVSMQFTWKRRITIALDAASGMSHLHRLSQPIIHRDLKSRNVLVDSSWHAKISDYNSDKILYGEQQGAEQVQQEGIDDDVGVSGGGDGTKVVWNSTTSRVKDPRWLAPEVITGGVARSAADVYAFGVILWELVTWKEPWEESKNDPDSIVQRVAEGERLPLPAKNTIPGSNRDPFSSYPHIDRLLMMIRRCWLQKPSSRPKFSAIVKELRAQLDALGGDVGAIEAQMVNPHSAARQIEKMWAL